MKVSVAGGQRRWVVDDEAVDAPLPQDLGGVLVERPGQRGAGIEAGAEDAVEGRGAAGELGVERSLEARGRQRGEVERHERAGEDLVARRGPLQRGDTAREIGPLAGDRRATRRASPVTGRA